MDEADEDVLERAFAAAQVLEADAEVAHPGQQGRDAVALGIGVERIDELVPVAGDLEVPVRQSAWNAVEAFVEGQGQLPLAELLHQLDLFLDEDQLAPADHPDAVGHLLRFLDIMGGEDDGDSGFPESPYQLPHVAP